jgi:TP901 family phage tail tape measure protein
MGALPPVFIEFLGKKTGFSATAAGVRSELAETEAAGAGSMSRLGAVSKAALLGIGVAAGVAAVKTVHMAADFQTQMTRVRTGAGELQKNMASVSQGVLQMAGEVGQSTSELTSGLYMVESAGFHGADALKVLKVSAEGAKVGAADMASVTDATTTALNAYKMGASDVTGVMNALVATEASGKTNMEALAGSMSSILPVAASAHVGLNEVLGAMATMTAQGTSAKVAATYLRQTIGQLSNPTAKAANEMKSLGLNAHDVAKNLGKSGLASTLTMLTDAIEKHMGPGGDVLINKLKAASTHATEFQKVLANLPPTQQTYIGALATMVGGTKSMMAALQLTGPHMETFQQNVRGIGEHVKSGGKEVEGWSDVQKTFNQRLAEAKGSMQAIGIEIGTALLPYAMKAVTAFSQMVTWMTRHKVVVELLGAAIGGILVIGLAAATIAAWNFTAAILANPLTWIVVGIMALIAGLVYLIIHWKQVAAWLSTAWHATVTGLVAAWHWLADNTVAIWNDDIVSPVMAAWNAVAAFFVSTYHAVVDPIVNAWNMVASVTKSVWNAIAGFFKTWWPLLFVIFLPGIALLVGAWNRFHKTVFSVVRVVWTSVLAFFRTIWGAVRAVAAFEWHATQVAIIEPVVATIDYVRSVWNSAMRWLGSMWSTIRGGASAGWERVRSAIVAPIARALSAVKAYMVDVKNAIFNKMNDAYNSILHFGDRFSDVGYWIVMGIVHGVENAGGYLKNEVSNLAHDALHAAMNVLDINSPSKVFAKIVGRAIPEGIAKGVTDNAHLAVRAVSSLAAGLPTDGPSIGSAVSLGTSGGSGTVVRHETHVHVTVQGSVLSERDLRDTVQKEMLRLGSRNSATWASYRR